MSKIDDLIAALCPDGVEYKCLGGPTGLCDVLPSGVDKVINKDECKVKLCNYMDVYNNQYITDDLITSFLDGSVNDREYQKFVLRAGQVLLTKDSETKEDIAQSAYVCKDYDDVVCGYHLAVVTPKNTIDGKYLNYVLHSQDLRNYFSKMANGVSRFGLKLKSIEDALIPLPPLPIQQEIVRILDKITALQAELKTELEAELDARKIQYEYYRDSLLTHRNEWNKAIRWLTLGEVCKSVSTGGTPLKSHTDYYGGSIPWLRTQEVRFVDITDTENKITQLGLENSSAKWIPANCVIVAISGATAARCAINKIPVTTNQHCCNLEIDKSFALYRYVFYWVSSQYEQLKALGQGARNDLNLGIITQYPIPVPPLEEQERIVAILDRFDALVNDITQALPAEIAARRKQYEYYRDKLFTFKEKVS